ncbi:MAG: alpha/beta hydrolase [Erysipelotrichales bacterium]|nr:alpha/beta hydrolase [Erysipelotrichales bacterium]
MKIVEYGEKNADIIILLHGGGLSWWNYREVAELLQKDYHVVIPILDGHSGSDKPFISIEDNASEIIEHIDEKYNGSVALIGGLSLGGQILIEILSQRSDICKIAIIESALIIPMKMTHYLVKPMMEMSYGLIKQEWFAKLQFQSLRIKCELYDEYYRDTCNITKENMISFLSANSWYSIKENIANTQAKVFVVVGQKEGAKMIRSAYKLNKMIPNSILEIKNEMCHGEYSINYAKEYASKVISMLEGI